MRVYVALVEDRRTSTEVRVFAGMDESIRWARRIARESSPTGEVAEMSDDDLAGAEWLYCATYSDGNRVRVVQVEVVA